MKSNDYDIFPSLLTDVVMYAIINVEVHKRMREMIYTI